MIVSKNIELCEARSPWTFTVYLIDQMLMVPLNTIQTPLTYFSTYLADQEFHWFDFSIFAM